MAGRCGGSRGRRILENMGYGGSEDSRDSGILAIFGILVPLGFRDPWKFWKSEDFGILNFRLKIRDSGDFKILGSLEF